MKSYDQTVDAVFDRIRDYNVKKKRRTVLACRVTAACCAVSLLGGSVWYLNRPQHDIPVTITPDENEVTTTAVPTEGEDTTTTTTVNTTAPEPTTDGGVVTPPTTAPAPSKPTATQAPTTGKTEPPKSSSTKQSITVNSTTSSKIEPPKTTTTTAPQKIVITADEPDDYTVDGEFWSNQEKYISFALEKAMEEYKDANVLYAVVVSVIMTDYDYSHGKAVAEQDPEVIRLAEEKKIALDAYLEAMEKFFGDRWNEEVRAKRQVFDEIADQYFQLYHKIAGEYVAKTILLPRVDALTEFSKTKPLPLSADMDFLNESLLNTAINIGGKDSFYVELTADAISELANRGGYVFWLASFDNETGFFPGIDNE